MDDTPENVHPAGALSRRGVVAAGGVLLTGLALEASPVGRQVLEAITRTARTTGVAGSTSRTEAARTARKTPPKPTKGVVVEKVRRASDLLVADFVLLGLKTVGSGTQAHLTPRSKSGGHLAIVLPGQSMGETPRAVGDAVKKKAVTVTTPELASPAVLVFKVPWKHNVPRSLAGLLDWVGLTGEWSTSSSDHGRLEVPYRLLLEPHPSLGWAHAAEPVAFVQADGRTTTEVWHTRLARKATVPGGVVLTYLDERDPTDRVAKVVDHLKTPMKTTLEPDDRATINQQAKSFTTSARTAPIRVDRLQLSSLGATAELAGRWPNAADLLSWDHRTTFGRDQYVKVVHFGWLAPFGHKAAKVTETWRHMVHEDGKAVASLASRTYVILLDRDVDTGLAYARGGGQGRPFPFSTVTCLARLTPDVVVDDGGASATGKLLRARAKTVDPLGPTFVLPFLGTDWAGGQHGFSAVTAFIENKGNPVNAAARWNTLTTVKGFPLPATSVDLGGQPVALAPEGGTSGSTTMSVGIVHLQVTPVPGNSLDPRRAPFGPVSDAITATSPALSALVGPQPVLHAYHPAFVSNGTNPGGVVLQSFTGTSPGVAAQVPTSRTGGFAPPPGTYLGLSTKVGAVLASAPGHLDDLATGATPDPAKVFGDIELLGGITLADLVDLGSGLGSVPALTHVTDGGRQTVTLTVSPPIHDLDTGVGLVLQVRPGGALTITGTTSSGGDAPTEQHLEAQLRNVALQLAGLVVLPIDALRITSSSSTPLDVELHLGAVQYLGPLAYVQPLAAIIAALVGGEGDQSQTGKALPARTSGGSATAHGLAPTIAVDAQGISVVETVALPDVAIGLFTLSGVSFSLGLVIPFTSDFSLELDFASRQDPFTVTYGPFGGGGYFHLVLGAGDVKLLEVSLDVAGAVGVNLGVASGGVSVAAGFILTLPAGGPVSITAFARASGCLDVLGLVSISVVFEIDLTFTDSSPCQLTGTASVELTVKVLFVHKTVTASISRTYSGGNPGTALKGNAQLPHSTEGSADFGDVMSSADWTSYCNAFTPRGKF